MFRYQVSSGQEPNRRRRPHLGLGVLSVTAVVLLGLAGAPAQAAGYPSPSVSPSKTIGTSPTTSPTSSPTVSPSKTGSPTYSPTVSPTVKPTGSPTVQPTSSASPTTSPARTTAAPIPSGAPNTGGGGTAGSDGPLFLIAGLICLVVAAGVSAAGVLRRRFVVRS